MNKCYLTNCNRGIGTISKKQDIKTIYHGDLQNGYDKGDLFDANAVIDQIKKYNNESGDNSTSKKALEIQLDLSINLNDFYISSDSYGISIRFKYCLANGQFINLDQIPQPEDLYNVDCVNIYMINIEDPILKKLFLDNNKLTFDVQYRTMDSASSSINFVFSDIINDIYRIKLNFSTDGLIDSYLDFELFTGKFPTANKDLKYICDPNIIISNVLDFNKYYDIKSSDNPGAIYMGIPQLARQFGSNSVEQFPYGTCTIKFGTSRFSNSFAKALVTVTSGTYWYHFKMTLDFVIPKFDSYNYSNKFEGCRARILIGVSGSDTTEQMIIYPNTSSSADLNWNEL